jgi:hypothetical protein
VFSSTPHLHIDRNYKAATTKLQPCDYDYNHYWQQQQTNEVDIKHGDGSGHGGGNDEAYEGLV